MPVTAITDEMSFFTGLAALQFLVFTTCVTDTFGSHFYNLLIKDVRVVFYGDNIDNLLYYLLFYFECLYI